MSPLLWFLLSVYVLGAGSFFLLCFCDDDFPACNPMVQFLGAILLGVLWPFIFTAGVMKAFLK